MCPYSTGYLSFRVRLLITTLVSSDFFFVCRKLNKYMYASLHTVNKDKTWMVPCPAFQLKLGTVLYVVKNQIISYDDKIPNLLRKITM